MNGSIQVYYGLGRGKTTAVLGLGARMAGMGKQVIMVQFLKKKHSETLDFVKRLEPELKIFRFETAACGYASLSPEEKKDQLSNIKTALSYTKKVIQTEQCDLLILDGALSLIEHNILTEEELIELLGNKEDSMTIILTGRILPLGIREIADCIYHISVEKETCGEMLSTD